MSAEDYVVKNTDQQALQTCRCNAGCRNDGNPMKVLDPPYSGKKYYKRSSPTEQETSLFLLLQK
jgi:hypothetical protein